MPVPARPKIYHIVHVDRLDSIIADGYLWCDAETGRRPTSGTTIGMDSIKSRRLNQLTLGSHPDLYVGDCVPFYFCPRSVMLYVLHRGNNSELRYRGGQDPIIHLEADLRETVAWADDNDRRWAFTSSNAGSWYFEDYNDLSQLREIDWDAVKSRYWSGEYQEYKQAEFLVEESFPWELVSRIGVHSRKMYARVTNAIRTTVHRPEVRIMRRWYY
ncbi:MAG: DUF4433 domain-containing protein [Dehalococcoidia bacterium]|nr:DUF4433 domain-containing protein [Dehalococcoidia bacterium]